MHSKNRIPRTSMKERILYEVRKDKDGNDLRVGDFVTLLGTNPQHHGYFKVIDLYGRKACVRSLEYKQNNWLDRLIGYDYVTKAENSPELTALILTL